MEKILLQKAKQKLTQTELDNYFTWVKAVWVNSKGESLDFKNYPYLVDIYSDQHPHIVLLKASQVGISERLISEAVWVCDRLKKNALFVFPTSSQLGDFVQARIDPVFNQSDYLSRITGVLSVDEKKEKNVENAKKVQKVGLKQIRDAFLYLRGSQNQQQIISVDADIVILDERDRFIQEHIPYIDKRLLHSTLRWRREASTPTFPGIGIDEAYANTDRRIWMLTCSKCKLEQELSFFDNIDFKKRITVCTRCKEPLNRLQKGKWVAQNPKNKIHGYRISGLVNPSRDTGYFIDEYEKARHAGFSAMQQFYNQVLGLPYESSGQKLLLSDLDDCKQNYKLPYEASDCFMGVDVGEVNNIIVSKKMANGKLRYVYVGTVQDFLGPVDSIEAIMVKYNVQMLVVDAKPETRKVQELIVRFPGKVFAAYYPTRKFDVQNYHLFDEFKSEVYIDKTISLDYLTSDIQNEQIELPSGAQYIPEFYKQMTAATRQPVVNPRTGQAEAKWIEKGPDHYLHAANYNRMASLRGVVNQALLDSYSEEKSIEPDSIAGWANLVRTKGMRMN